MIKLKKFYDLMHKSATITLTDRGLNHTYYVGPVKNIPDEYDECTVIDFIMNADGDMLFEIKKEAGGHD